jgi:hypothetical protein
VLKIRDLADAKKRQKARKLLQDYFAQTEDLGVEKHEAHAVSGKVSLADCGSIAALLRSAFLASGTLVLAGLFTGPALPGSLFRERLRSGPLHRGGPSAVAVARGWPRLALIR